MMVVEGPGFAPAPEALGTVEADAVRRGHPAYRFIRDGDGDGVVCE